MAELSVDRLGESVAGLQALEGLALLVTDGKGEVVRSPNAEDRLHRRNVRDQPVITEALQRGAAHRRLTIDGAAYEGYALRMDRIGWIVYAGYPVVVTEAASRSALFVAAVTTGVAIVVGLGLFWITAAWLQRRLRRSITYAEAVTAGQHPPVPQGSTIVEMAALE